MPTAQTTTDELDRFFTERCDKLVEVELMDGSAARGFVIGLGGAGSGRYALLGMAMGGHQFGIRYSEMAGVADV